MWYYRIPAGFAYSSYVPAFRNHFVFDIVHRDCIRELSDTSSGKRKGEMSVENAFLMLE